MKVQESLNITVYLYRILVNIICYIDECFLFEQYDDS